MAPRPAPTPRDRCLDVCTAPRRRRTPSARSVRCSRRRTACGSTPGRTSRRRGRPAVLGRPIRAGGWRRASPATRSGMLPLQGCLGSPRTGTLRNRISCSAVVTVAVPAETAAAERRVALVPEVIARLTGAGAEVVVQAGAGKNASYDDDAYTEAGARVLPDAAAVFGAADVVVKVAPPSVDEAGQLA